MCAWHKGAGGDVHLPTAGGKVVVEPGEESMHGASPARHEPEGDGLVEGRLRDLEAVEFEVQHFGGVGDDGIRKRRPEEAGFEDAWFDGAEVETVHVVPV